MKTGLGLGFNKTRPNGKVYGIRISVADGSVQRTYNSEGKRFAVHEGGYNPDLINDFDYCYPWSTMRAVKTNENGDILAYFGDTNYDSVDGNYNTKIANFFCRDEIIQRQGVYYREIEISDTPRAGFDPAFIGTDRKPKQYDLIGRMPVTNENGVLVTKPSSPINIKPIEVSRSMVSFMDMAESKGDGNWTLYDAKRIHAICCLMWIEAGSLNCRESYGQGINSGLSYGSGDEYKCIVPQVNQTSIIVPSTTANFHKGMLVQIGTLYYQNNIAANRYITSIDEDVLGLKINVSGNPFNTIIGDSIVTWGQPVPAEQIDALHGGSGFIFQFGNENKSHVCYRGIWDLWGNVWQWTAGFLRFDGVYYVCNNPSKYNIQDGGVWDPRAADGWTEVLNSDYLPASDYQKERIPIKTEYGTQDVPWVVGDGAGANTFYCAYLYYFTNVYAGVRALLSGGGWSYGSRVSPVCGIGSYAPGSTSIHFGARLIRK